jgi:transcriptional regulator with GAF, ATPase, and Fis domain
MLLRVLQEKEIKRVGRAKTIPVNVRVVAATNDNLEELVKHKVLSYRICITG